jgi:hypothetical protein
VSEEADGRLRPIGRKKDRVGGVSRSDLALLLVLDWSLHSRGGRPRQTLRKTCQSQYLPIPSSPCELVVVDGEIFIFA